MNDLDKYYPDAKRYNKEYKDITQDIPFIIDLAKKYAKNGTVLELGCGTGRITFSLAKEGIKSNFNVIGVDASSIMINYAKNVLGQSSNNIKSHLKLVQGDMRDVYFENNYFDIILITFNSFLHLKNSQDYHKTLNNIYKQLKPGGYFMADISTVGIDFEDIDKIKNEDKAKKIKQEYKIIDDEHITYRKGEFEYDYNTQILKGFWNYKIYKNNVNNELDNTKKLVESFSAPIEIRYIFKDEWINLLQSSGFEILKKWGSYNKEDYNDNSDKMLFLCRKSLKVR